MCSDDGAAVFLMLISFMDGVVVPMVMGGVVVLMNRFKGPDS